MSGSQKGGAYARALARELPLEHGDLRAIASRLGLQIREVDADGFDGALIRAREIPLGTIAIRQSIREAGRKNFTLAHEIAHFLLPDHDLTELVCTKSDIGNWGDWSRELEREADEFAAELLLPASAVQPIVESAPPSLQVIEKIAQRFHTSLSAAAWRYCDLSKQSCAIVWATNDRIDWSKRSRHFGFPLQKGAPLQQGTFALQCFAGTPGPSRPQELPARLWISATGFPEDAPIWEESKALPAYNSVISLLWIKS